MHITGVIDAILGSPLPSDSSVKAIAEFSHEGTVLQRSFEYVEGDRSSSQAWLLTQKQFDIEYIRGNTLGEGTHEVYKIYVYSFVQREGATKDGVENTYFIEYFGADRSSTTSTMWQPNLTEPNMVTRETTPYDQTQLLSELIGLRNALTAGEQEDSIIAALNKHPE